MTIKEARLKAGLTQQAMSDLMMIPRRTIQDWEAEKRKCPPYIERFILKELEEIADKRDSRNNTNNISNAQVHGS